MESPPNSRHPTLTRLFAIICAVARAALMMALAVTAAHAQASKVRIGIFVTSISDVEPGDGSFTISGYGWTVAAPGTFNPLTDLELIARNTKLAPVADNLLPDGTRQTIFGFDAVVDHAFDVRKYPFDKQVLSLSIEARAPVESVVFVPDQDDSRVAPFVRAPGWTIRQITLATSDQRYGTGFGHRTGDPAFSRLTANIPISRHISPALFEKFTGFFVALAITILVLFVPVAEFGTRVSMTTGSVFAAVLNRYRFEDSIGFDAVFGTVDQVSAVTFLAIIAILMLSITAHHLAINDRKTLANRLNRNAGAVVVGVSLAALALAFASALLD